MVARYNLLGKQFGKLTVVKMVAGYRSPRQLPTWKCRCDCGNVITLTTSMLLGGRVSCGCRCKKVHVGQKFGWLTVVKDLGVHNHARKWECVCRCGHRRIFSTGNLNRGSYKSCGCHLSHKLVYVGQRFGRLTVAKRLGVLEPHGPVKWVCVCDCGGIHVASTGNLNAGQVRSCGCLSRVVNARMGRARAVVRDKLMVGRRFGRWVVVKRLRKWRCDGQVYYECVCDCGTTRAVELSRLINGGSRSCGCIARDKVRERDAALSGEVVGKRFGMLVVLRLTEKRGKRWYAECACDCGVRKEVSVHAMRSCGLRSCGCLANKKMRDRAGVLAKNVTGKRFGRLTVLRLTGRRDGRWYAECACDCGATKEVQLVCLMRGSTRSCGCYNVAYNMTRYSTLSPEDIPPVLASAKMMQSKIKRRLTREVF